MTSKFFERVYKTTTQDAVEGLYDEWAETYDADVVSNGYVTPARCAAALAGHLADRTAPIFDFACGTGLSGAALAAEGFSVIDGIDLSDSMLAAARSRGIYRTLFKAEPEAPPPISAGDYKVIAAIGAISPGAAPPLYLDILIERLAPGDLFLLSFNEHTRADPDYADRLDSIFANGSVRTVFEEDGDHLVKLGSRSTVYILEKQG